MELYKSIQQYRKEAGLSQEQLAEKLNVSRQAVSKWESGAANPDMDRLNDICLALNVNLSTLLGINTAKNQAYLSNEQLIEIGKLVSDITSAQQRRRTKKHILFSIGAIAVFTIVLGGAAYYVTNNINSKISALESQIGNVNSGSNIVYTPNPSPAENGLVVDYNYAVVNTNAEKQTLTLKLTATPKTYRNNTTAEFAFVGIKSTLTAPAILENGVFVGEITIPADDTFNFQIRFNENEEITTASLEILYDLPFNYFLTINASSSIEATQKDDNSLQIGGEVKVEVRVPENDKAIYPIVGNLYTTLNGKIVYTQSIDTIDPYNKTGDNLDSSSFYSGADYYLTVENTIENIKTGDTVCILAKLTPADGSSIEKTAYEYVVK